MSQNVVQLYRQAFKNMMVDLGGACAHFRQREPGQRKLSEKQLF